ncbi:hypothetical protein C7M84_004663 [Penaeus vannamei]|uniref:Uncharacterized protein n=1 Tax=Penaeus vannamei TaxID=6689 RepID=A0A3R7PMG4_PENVA|nr:hypothetical protein C7M84_004663 [Penaeus vannamei]
MGYQRGKGEQRAGICRPRFAPPSIPRPSFVPKDHHPHAEPGARSCEVVEFRHVLMVRRDSCQAGQESSWVEKGARKADQTRLRIIRDFRERARVWKREQQGEERKSVEREQLGEDECGERETGRRGVWRETQQGEEYGEKATRRQRVTGRRERHGRPRTPTHAKGTYVTAGDVSDAAGAPRTPPPAVNSRPRSPLQPGPSPLRLTSDMDFVYCCVKEEGGRALVGRGHRARACLPAHPAPSPFVTARLRSSSSTRGISSPERSPPGADERAAHLYCSLPYPQVCPITSDPAGASVLPPGARERLSEPLNERKCEPLSGRLSERFCEPLRERLNELLSVPLGKRLSEPLSESLSEPLREHLIEPLNQRMSEPLSERLSEP